MAARSISRQFGHTERNVKSQFLHNSIMKETREFPTLRDNRALGDHLDLNRGGLNMPKPKILVIEDERSLVEILTYNLEREGFEVLTSHDGQDGLRQAQLKLPDLIVLDLMLPVKPGMEVCRELRNGTRTRDIPIVMVTAKAEESDQLVGFAMGADDYVTKPYSVKVLIERIKKELRKRQSQDEPSTNAIIESQGVTIDRHSHRADRKGSPRARDIAAAARPSPARPSRTHPLLRSIPARWWCPRSSPFETSRNCWAYRSAKCSRS